MIADARAAGLAVHVTSHFSYRMTDARIASLVESNHGHLTVAVDGATQATYAGTRLRRRLPVVLDNLARLVAHRVRQPFVEVQHLQFAHHPPGELEWVARRSLLGSASTSLSLLKGCATRQMALSTTLSTILPNLP